MYFSINTQNHETLLNNHVNSQDFITCQSDSPKSLYDIATNLLLQVLIKSNNSKTISSFNLFTISTILRIQYYVLNYLVSPTPESLSYTKERINNEAYQISYIYTAYIDLVFMVLGVDDKY